MPRTQHRGDGTHKIDSFSSPAKKNKINGLSMHNQNVKYNIHFYMFHVNLE